MNPYAFVHKNPLKYIDLFGTSRHHGYKKCNSFEEYFYDSRTNEIKKGGDTFIVGGQAVTINDNYEFSEGFKRFVSDSKEAIIDVRDTVKDYSYLIDTTLGLLEIGAGFIGLEGSVAFEIGTLGLGTLVAAPVAAGATVLIADGSARIGNGYTLFKKASKNYDHNLDKQHKGTLKSNVAQNKQARDARREIEQEIGRLLTDRERRILHDAIHGQNYGYWEIVEEGIALFKKL